MSMAEYAVMDQEWYEEALTAVQNFRAGQAHRREIDAQRAKQKAG
jgi:hypothetical protein